MIENLTKSSLIDKTENLTKSSLIDRIENLTKSSLIDRIENLTKSSLNRWLRTTSELLVHEGARSHGMLNVFDRVTFELPAEQNQERTQEYNSLGINITISGILA